jgi:hypothetical protein
MSAPRHQRRDRPNAAAALGCRSSPYRELR